jgi:hypothetical protein
VVAVNKEARKDSMNYIKQLQADKAEALDAARSIETEINHLISYYQRATARYTGHHSVPADIAA